MDDQIRIHTEDDIYHALSLIRHAMHEKKFSETQQQMVLVSVSELTRNVLVHARADGVFRCGSIEDGIEFRVEDFGPGIVNIDCILNGKSSHSPLGLGLGLSGVQRLMDELMIETDSGGTKIIARKWKQSRRGIYAQSTSSHW